MDFFNSWLQGIIIAVIISTIIEMILPNGNSKKYIKIVLGVYVVFNIITPVANKLINSNFELSTILNVEEYSKKMESYETITKNIEINKSNEENIKQIYTEKLKKDISTKLEEKGYDVKKIQIEIQNDETYLINKISLFIENTEKEELPKEQENKIVINEIEKVEIQIGEYTKEINDKKSELSEKEKNEIKQYLISVYEVKEKQIEIY